MKLFERVRNKKITSLGKKMKNMNVLYQFLWVAIRVVIITTRISSQYPYPILCSMYRSEIRVLCLHKVTTFAFGNGNWFRFVFSRTLLNTQCKHRLRILCNTITQTLHKHCVRHTMFKPQHFIELTKEIALFKLLKNRILNTRPNLG